MPALLGAGASDAKRSAADLRRARAGEGALRGARRRGAPRVPRRAHPVRAHLLVRLPDRRRSPTRRWSATTSTAARCRSTCATPATVERLDLGTEVELTHLRHQMTFSGTLVADRRRSARCGRSSARARAASRSSTWSTSRSIVEVLNERFGTDLTDVDKLLFDQFEESWVADDELSDQAQNNTHRQLPARLRPQVPADDRHPRWTPTTRSSSRSSTTRTSARLLGEFYLRKVYERLREAA